MLYMNRYDVIVIGGGPGGGTLAQRLAHRPIGNAGEDTDRYYHFDEHAHQISVTALVFEMKICPACFTAP